jgi:hypothetical protein
VPFSNSKDRHPLQELPQEDLDLITALVLQSGSLKGLAAEYGVSYPTIRARLDKVIARLRGVIDGQPPDRLTELLANLVERGELASAGARSIRDLVRAERDGSGAGRTEEERS